MKKVYPCADARLGASKLSILIWILLLASIVDVAIKIVPVYITNYQIQNLFEVNANRIQTTPIRDIRADITSKLKNIHAPLTINDVSITQDGTGAVTISATYSVVVKFIDGYKITLHFSPKARSHAR